MKNVEEVAKEIVDAALKIHRKLGPGLLESAYEACLEYELIKRGLIVSRQLVQPIQYEETTIDAGYRIDLLVDNSVIIELKSVDQLAPIHTAQIITYLKLSGKSLGFLINFNVPILKQGLKRVVHNHQSS